jgi:hypothetical protein
MARLQTGGLENVSFEYRVRHADGQYRWMLCRGAMRRGANGAPIRAAGSQTDITSRKMAGRYATKHLMTPSPVCRIGLLSERLALRGSAAARPELRYAVMFIDLDRFKVINDSLGHGVGDALLVSVRSGSRPAFARWTQWRARTHASPASVATSSWCCSKG